MQFMKIKNLRKIMMVVFVVILILSFGVNPVLADKEATAGREIVKKWQDVVVTVKMVVKTRMVVEGREISKHESKAEATATIIDSSGLSVLSLSATNPSGIFSRIGGSKYQWESELTDVKIRLSDGKEVPAEVVLRDKDLDLAFVRPNKKVSPPLTALNLSSNTEPEVLDKVVILSRLGKVGGWVPFVSISRIQAIITKPRTFYVPGQGAMESGLGVPAFSLRDGNIIGILLLRTIPSRGSVMGAMFSGISNIGMLPVILPAKDIVEVAKQILESK